MDRENFLEISKNNVFKRDRAYKFILRGWRKVLKNNFFNSKYGNRIYRISDKILFERASQYLREAFPYIQPSQ